MSDDKLAMEEARRAGQHGAVKSQVEGEVQAEIAESAAAAPPAEGQKIDQVAGDSARRRLTKLSRLSARWDARVEQREFPRSSIISSMCFMRC